MGADFSIIQNQRVTSIWRQVMHINELLPLLSTTSCFPQA